MKRTAFPDERRMTISNYNIVSSRLLQKLMARKSSYQGIRRQAIKETPLFPCICVLSNINRRLFFALLKSPLNWLVIRGHTHVWGKIADTSHPTITNMKKKYYWSNWTISSKNFWLEAAIKDFKEPLKFSLKVCN